jgi:hypothetical protein
MRLCEPMNSATCAGCETIQCAHAAASFFSGNIPTKGGTCSYYETFEYEWPSYFLIRAATKITSRCSALKRRKTELVVQHTLFFSAPKLDPNRIMSLSCDLQIGMATLFLALDGQ